MLWQSGSGAILGLAGDAADGFTMVRISGHAPLPMDGFTLMIDRLDATSCGLWTADGYVSTPPVLVTSHPLGTPMDLEVPRQRQRWQDLLLAANKRTPDWRARIRAGHPDESCPVPQCAKVVASP